MTPRCARFGDHADRAVGDVDPDGHDRRRRRRLRSRRGPLSHRNERRDGRNAEHAEAPTSRRASVATSLVVRQRDTTAPRTGGRRARRAALAGCGGGAKARVLGAAGRRPRGHARRCRDVDRRRQREPTAPRWRFRAQRRGQRPRASSRRRPSPTATPSTSRTCSSNVFALDRATGSVALDAPLPRARTRARTASPSTADASTARPTRTRSRSTPRPGRELWRRHLTSAREQFVDVAPVAVEGARLHEHGRLPPVRPRGDLRARRRDRAGALEVRHDRDAVAATRARRAAAARGTRSRSTTTGALYAGNSNPTRGAARRSARTAAPSPALPSTPTRCSCSTR